MTAILKRLKKMVLDETDVLPTALPRRHVKKKMILDAILFNTQHYKARIKSKVGQSWEKSNALPYTLVY